ncbi:unnamed protein product [Ceutorhynchus assimilis]|uniref:Retrotransposon gag domain-containing protein n=1 Tax=Ceutorhynchus assimilis TaxID=467358 RepID=A0A9N9QDK4_9CUCU|nr:unnamed protein product [Ceutorhynchus assimilis]
MRFRIQQQMPFRQQVTHLVHIQTHLSMSEGRFAEELLVEDYFKRFDWALQLSRIPVDDHGTYARVHMGAELYNALKFLISPRSPENLSYAAIKTTLIEHFDHSKNKYAEIIKFRQITQQENETVAQFTLRLRQGAAHCEYGGFLDRMLVEPLLHGLRSREMCEKGIAKNPTSFTDTYRFVHELEVTHHIINEVKLTAAGSAPETVAQFTLRLRQGAAHCEYGGFLDRMLVEPLLHGLRYREMCDEGIDKNPTSFTDAYRIVHELEATHHITNEVKLTAAGSAQSPVESMNKLGYAAPQTRRDHKPSIHKSMLDDRAPQGSIQGAIENRRPYCNGCGGSHLCSQCFFWDKICRICKKKGHIGRVCKSRLTEAISQIHNSEQPVEGINFENIDFINYVKKINVICGADPSAAHRMIEVQIDGHRIEMELDTGAPCAIISEKTLRSIKPKFSLLKSDRQFASYTRHKVICLGRLPVHAKIGKKTTKLNVYVVKGDFDALLGREWITYLSYFIHGINFAKLFPEPEQVHMISTGTPCLSQDQKNRLDLLLAKYENVFSPTAGKLKGPPEELHLKPGARPVFAKTREIPLALRDMYAREIVAKIATGLY